MTRPTLRRLGDLAAVALLVFAFSEAAMFLRQHLRDPEDWMRVNRIAIPDHAAGTDPAVLYDRTVLRPFTAVWFVELRRLEPDAPAHTVCAASGESLYEPEEAVGTLPLSEYFGARCVLPPGRYLARTLWRLENGLSLRHSTDPFTVTEPDP